MIPHRMRWFAAFSRPACRVSVKWTGFEWFWSLSDPRPCEGHVYGCRVRFTRTQTLELISESFVCFLRVRLLQPLDKSQTGSVGNTEAQRVSDRYIDSDAQKRRFSQHQSRVTRSGRFWGSSHSINREGSEICRPGTVTTRPINWCYSPVTKPIMETLTHPEIDASVPIHTRTDTERRLTDAPLALISQMISFWILSR